jgi:hypothetical protein
LGVKQAIIFAIVKWHYAIVFRLDNLKLKSLTRTQFHAFGRDKIKLDQLKIALNVVGHASLLQSKIGKSECYNNVIEQSLLQPLLLVS